MSVSRLTLARTASLGTALLAALLLAGCAGTPSPGTPVASKGGSSAQASTPTPEAQNSDVFDLEVGDCLLDTTDTTVSDVPLIDCSAPHDLEVFYEFDLTENGDFPGSAALTDTAEAGCKEQFATFVGLDYDHSALVMTEYVPTVTSWASGDRSVSCVLGAADGTTTGTLKGAGR